MNKRKKIVTTTTTVTEEFVPDYKKTHIICVLDRSGSMKYIMDDSIGGFNSFIEKQKELPDEATLSVYIFDSEIEIIRENVNIKDVKPVTIDEWYPRGMTSLYDAIGTAINSEKKNIDVNTKVLVCVVTDGDENNSKEYKQSDIKTLISDCEKDDWTFIFLAANQDACFVGKSLGFACGNTYTYQASTAGVRDMSNAMNYATTSYRSNTGNNSNLLGNNTDTVIVDSINDSLKNIKPGEAGMIAILSNNKADNKAFNEYLKNNPSNTLNMNDVSNIMNGYSISINPNSGVIWHHTDTKTDENK